MKDRDHDVLANVDLGVLGKAMLDAARAARIGATLTLIDSPQPRNIYVSEAAADIMGWTVAELLAQNPMDNIAPEDVQRMRERLVERAGGKVGENTSEILAVTKDGRRIPIEVTASQVTIDGRPAVFAFIVDVSARKAAEAQRLSNEARFRELIESAPEPIGIVREGRFVYANRAYVTTLGFADAAALYEIHVTSLLEGEDAATYRARESQILERDLNLPAQVYRLRRSDGAVVLLEVSSVRFEYGGKPSVLNIARDITERKHLEAQLVQSDRLAALGIMAAGVAHEINNPLAYVMLNLEWLLRKLPQAAHDPSSIAGLVATLEEAKQGAQRVSTIVRELSRFSRADGETRRPVHLAEVVASAIKVTGHEIRHRARVSTSFESVRPVWANEARLEQVVINLLLNASQAVPENRWQGNEIRVSVREDSDGRAVLEVSDNGEGIPADVQQRVFDPFFTTKPVGVGTGLGLSICHGIVTSLGGSIAAYSEPGKGATFRVVLPTTHLRDEEPQAARAEPALSANGRRARILVVDDEVPIANTMQDLLGVDHEVVVATSGRDALAMVGSAPAFDVIFCDLMMPGMSGVDLYEQLAKHFPGAERKLVFMTGGAFTTRAAEFLASVHNRRVEKPFSLGLLERIAREMAAGGGGEFPLAR